MHPHFDIRRITRRRPLMRNWTYQILALAVLPAPALAQDITGTWQGTLVPPNAKHELRI
jgi:hypothetical protein